MPPSNRTAVRKPHSRLSTGWNWQGAHVFSSVSHQIQTSGHRLTWTWVAIIRHGLAGVPMSNRFTKLSIPEALILMDRLLLMKAGRLKTAMFSLSSTALCALLITAQDSQVYDVGSEECGPGGQATWNQSPPWIYWHQDLGKSFFYTSAFSSVKWRGKK